MDQMLSKTGAIIERVPMETNETAIREQLAELQRKRVKNLVFFSRALNLERYTMQVNWLTIYYAVRYALQFITI